MIGLSDQLNSRAFGGLEEEIGHLTSESPRNNWW